MTESNKYRTPIKYVEIGEVYFSQRQATVTLGKHNAPISYACKSGSTAYGHLGIIENISEEEYKNIKMDKTIYLIELVHLVMYLNLF